MKFGLIKGFTFQIWLNIVSGLIGLALLAFALAFGLYLLFTDPAFSLS